MAMLQVLALIPMACWIVAAGRLRCPKSPGKSVCRVQRPLPTLGISSVCSYVCTVGRTVRHCYYTYSGSSIEFICLVCTDQGVSMLFRHGYSSSNLGAIECRQLSFSLLTCLPKDKYNVTCTRNNVKGCLVKDHIYKYRLLINSSEEDFNSHIKHSISILRKEVLVGKRELARNKFSKISVPDIRPLSRAIGGVAVIILICLVTFIVVLDVPRFMVQCKCIKRITKRIFKFK